MASTKPIERFEGNYEPVPWSGCWLWTGTLSDTGYGRFRSVLLGPGKHYAHRVSYKKFVGPIPKRMDVLHRCDVTCCVNPDHLFLGTQADNNRDRDAKGRQVGPHGHDNGMSKLDENAVRFIRASTISAVTLAPFLGINHATISRVRRRELWKHVDG